MAGCVSSSQRTAKTATAVASLTVSSASGITLTARALDQHKMDTIMKSESTGPYMPDNNPLSPSHYQWHPVAESREISGHFPHHLGAAIDYIWRVGRNDDPIQDINKAIRHLEFERDRLELMRPG